MESSDAAVYTDKIQMVVIPPSVAKQYKIVAGLLNRPDVETIYACTDSGREGKNIFTVW